MNCYSAHKDTCNSSTSHTVPTSEGPAIKDQNKELPTPGLQLSEELLDTFNKSETIRLHLSAILESTDRMSALRSAIQHAIDEGKSDEFSEFLLKVNKEL